MGEMDRAAGEGLVALQRCGGCGAWQYPPREVCRVCLAGELGWVVREAVAGELVAGASLAHSYEGGFELPVRVGLVRLEGEVTAVCFVAEGAAGRVVVRAGVDGAGRAVLTAGAG